LLQLLKKIRI